MFFKKKPPYKRPAYCSNCEFETDGFSIPYGKMIEDCACTECGIKGSLSSTKANTLRYFREENKRLAQTLSEYLEENENAEN